jgi:hypothetical protein
MITYLPDFLPDELFYSYVARYHHESGNISLRQTQLQIAAYYGRFCGAKRPQCEAERPGFLLI